MSSPLAGQNLPPKFTEEVRINCLLKASGTDVDILGCVFVVRLLEAVVEGLTRVFLNKLPTSGAILIFSFRALKVLTD